MLRDQVSVSVMCVPRYLELSTILTDEKWDEKDPLMESGVSFPVVFLKSTMISFVLLT